MNCRRQVFHLPDDDDDGDEDDLKHVQMCVRAILLKDKRFFYHFDVGLIR